MKQRITIVVALILLLAVIGFMARDLFFGKPANHNPYNYDLESLKQGDSLISLYAEVMQFTPGAEQISGIAVDPSGQILVCGKNTVAIHDAAGKPVSSFTIPGQAGCIATDGQLIYLGMDDHIEVYDRTGKPSAKWRPVNMVSLITSVAVNGDDVFAADAGLKIVYRYDREGKMVNRIGEKDPENGVPGFVIPSPYFDLCIGRKGELWIVNPGRHTVDQFTPDGKLMRTWGMASMAVDGFCGCCNPTHLAILTDGSFVTSEKGIERVKIYQPDGSFHGLVASPGQFDEGTRGLDLAVDRNDRILVLDSARKQVRVFERKLENP
jgi:sugar lactone lactonase YvrE